MSGFHPDADLRPYTGQRRVEPPILELGPIAPWHGQVIVEPVDLAGSLGWQFRITARWHGPANTGAPNPRTGEPEHDGPARDASFELNVADQALARAIAKAAADVLRHPEVPDLLALKRSLEQRES